MTYFKHSIELSEQSSNKQTDNQKLTELLQLNIDTNQE